MNNFKGFYSPRFELREIHFIKRSKAEIENKCNNAIEQYDFLDDNNGGYIKGWIESEKCRDILYIASPDVIEFPVDSSCLFSNWTRQIFNLEYLEKIEFDNINTSNVVNMSNMFSGLKNIKKLDLSMFDTSNVYNMEDMFNGCKNIQEINLDSFNTKKVETMSEMFCDCEKLEKLSLKNFDTSNVKIFDYTFGSMRSIKELNLSNFKREKFTNEYITYGMFNECSNLKMLDISQFEFGELPDDIYNSNYDEMFDGLPNDIKIYVKNDTEKNNVITIGMGDLEAKNIIAKSDII